MAIVDYEGVRFLVDEGDQILDVARVGAVWHVVRLTAAGDLDIRVFYSGGNGQFLWHPSTSKGISFDAWRVHAALVYAIGTEAEKAALDDSTDVPSCQTVGTPWNQDADPHAKHHTSTIASLEGEPAGCLHCSLVNLAEFLPMVDDSFAGRMQALGVPAVYLEEPALHLNVLASSPEWLAGAFRSSFDEAVYLQHREQVLADALTLSLHFGARRKSPTKKK